MIQTQRLDYTDHSEEIASLNTILAGIQSSGDHPELSETIAHILERLDHLMTAQGARLSLYDQRVSP